MAPKKGAKLPVAAKKKEEKVVNPLYEKRSGSEVRFPRRRIFTVATFFRSFELIRKEKNCGATVQLVVEREVSNFCRVLVLG
ncbi:hypothetical protein ACS0TY_000493 [Phlomoides rotata]